jgi:ubiquinone/menaquinone biosynthesis C-methylase UbiE
MDALTQAKWDRAAATLDIMSGYGPQRRWDPLKREFFAAMGDGKILFLAVGTGLDIPSFPPGKEIMAIDISPRMLARAESRAAGYPGKLELRVMDVHEMSFPEASFDQVFTSCTFCSVPDPVRGLEALRRVLKTGGELRMFEHTGSRFPPFRVMLDAMAPLLRRFGPEVNRRTEDNVVKAGFEIREVRNLFLDVVKTISAVAP